MQTAAASTRLKELFDDYSASHQARGNQVCHRIGIPLIVVSLFGILPISFGLLLMAMAGAWYVWMDWRLGLPFVFILGSAFFVGQTLPFPMAVALFVLGWVFQGIGHSVYEKKSPSFMGNLRHLLVGPIWIFERTFGSAGSS